MQNFIELFFSGYTFNINDAVMGITFLAVGGSIPEASSAIVNARNGLYVSNHIKLEVLSNMKPNSMKILLNIFQELDQ